MAILYAVRLAFLATKIILSLITHLSKSSTYHILLVQIRPVPDLTGFVLSHMAWVGARFVSLLSHPQIKEMTRTRGIQKVRSLIQLTTEYEHDILSLFNIVPFNRNALGPAILQSLYSIVEEFLILVLRPVTRSAGNIIVVRKFPSFHEFLQFWKQIEVTGGQV